MPADVSGSTPPVMQAFLMAAQRRCRLDNAQLDVLRSLTFSDIESIRSWLSLNHLPSYLTSRLAGMLPPAGQPHFGPFQPVAFLAEGGMGAIWLSVDPIGRRAVVKVMADQFAGNERRFEREMQATMRLHHPNVVGAFDAGKTDNGTAWLALEHVPGNDLDAVVFERGALPVMAALAVIRQVAAGLQAAHAVNLVHRDLKPSNLLITPDGHVKIADFGLVRDLAAMGTPLTQEGLTVGTPTYMAPEQVMGKNTVDIRSDLYATGAILGFCLRGQDIFEGTVREIMFKHLQSAPPKLPMSVPAPVSALYERCLTKNQDDRFQTPAELLARIDQVIAQCTQACMPPASTWFVRTQPQPKPATRPPVIIDGSSTAIGPWLVLTDQRHPAGAMVHCHAGHEVTIGKLGRPPVHIQSLIYPLATNVEMCQQIGRTHCCLSSSLIGYSIRDLGSQNGTTIDGSAVMANVDCYLPLGRASRIELAAVLTLEATPIPRRADPDDVKLMESKCEALVLTRPFNRPELSYALVQRRLRIGGWASDILVPHAPQDAVIELAWSDNAWWVQDSGHWKRITEGTRLVVGDLELTAHDGTFDYYT